MNRKGCALFVASGGAPIPSKTIGFTYTPTGKYLTSTDQTGTTNYTYDTMDRLTAKATPEGTLNYNYDAAGHVSRIWSSNTNGASMAYSYDDLNRLSTVTDNRTGGVTSYSYDSANNLGTVTYPNGVQSTFAYDTLNRVTGLSSQTASYSYQRGPTGNLTSVSESSGRQVNWTYDGIYRLTNETIALAPSKSDGTVGYGLDPVGNRLSESSSLPDISSGSWSYNPDDEVSSEAYDANGNVTSTGGKSFTYDSENHLISMSASGTSASIIYDGFGNRVAKTVNGVTTRYLVEGK
jgi:YD repeat-containing protein